MSMQVARLSVVYEWSCDNCGLTNIARGMKPTLTAEEKAEILEDSGVDLDEQGDLTMMPTVVKCQSCRTQYATHDADHECEDE